MRQPIQHVVFIALLAIFASACERDGGTIFTNDVDQVVFRSKSSPCGRQNVTLSNVRSSYQFTGYEKDSDTDLFDANARFYNQRHCRFTGLDPAQDDQLNGLSPYTYVRNNPLRLTDPTGKMPDDEKQQQQQVLKRLFDLKDTPWGKRQQLLALTKRGESTGQFQIEYINPFSFRNLQLSFGVRHIGIADVLKNEGAVDALTRNRRFTLFEAALTLQPHIVEEFRRKADDDTVADFKVPAGEYQRVSTGALNGLGQPPGLRFAFGIAPNAMSFELSLLSTFSLGGLKRDIGTNLYQIAGASTPLDVFARFNLEEHSETPGKRVRSFDFGGYTGFDFPVPGNFATLGFRVGGAVRRGPNDTTAIWQVRVLLTPKLPFYKRN